MFRCLGLFLLALGHDVSMTTHAAPTEDFIDELPLFGKTPTPQYSGYLDGTAGCDTATNGEFCKIHYWAALSEAGDDAPVVLWLNGGPGSSSILGFLQENGPLLMNATGGLMVNPWAWTKVAHMFVIESPIGVGYSYCANQELDGDTICQNTDKYTASTARAAIVDFFTNKFPEFLDNDFFITGESYAGVYIPTLAKELVDHAPQIPLVGLAVGDPCTDNEAQTYSMDPVWYSYKYGLLDDATYDTIWNHCDYKPSSPDFSMPLYQHKVSAKKKKKTTTNNSQQQQQENKRSNLRWVDLISNFEQHEDTLMSLVKDSTTCQLAFRKFLISSSHGLSQSWKHLYIDDYSLFAPVTNVEDEHMAQYMNLPQVKQALHVTETPIKTWPYPEGGFDYTKQYQACNPNPLPDAPSMIDIYHELAPQLQIILVYNGDTDPCVSYEGTRLAISRVGYPQIDGGSYRPWFYNHTATSMKILQEKDAMFGPDLLLVSTGPQFGGEIVNYQHNLSFLTIHGSGHMVPQFRPQAALHMLKKLLLKAPLSPLLPPNETLAHVPTKVFRQLMNEWTVQAMKAPYVLPE